MLTRVCWTHCGMNDILLWCHMASGILMAVYTIKNLNLIISDSGIGFMSNWQTCMVSETAMNIHKKYMYLDGHLLYIVTKTWVNIGSGNGLVPSPTNVDWSSVRSSDIHLRPNFTRETSNLSHLSLKLAWKLLIQDFNQVSQGPMS